MNDTDKKWVKAMSEVSRRIETAGSGAVQIYDLPLGDDEEAGTVDAEATLRHFLEVTCNIRISADHSGHKVPMTPGPGMEDLGKARGGAPATVGANEAPPKPNRSRFAR